MIANKLKDKIQLEALEKIVASGYNSTVCLDMGSGKSKVAIDCIKKGNFKNILITSPDRKSVV